MAYSEASKRAVSKYTKEKVKSILLRVKKSDYEDRILPAIKKTGLPVMTFIRMAIDEKIERDQLN